MQANGTHRVPGRSWWVDGTTVTQRFPRTPCWLTMWPGVNVQDVKMLINMWHPCLKIKQSHVTFTLSCRLWRECVLYNIIELIVKCYFCDHAR
jgi:hypothetical protein